MAWYVHDNCADEQLRHGLIPSHLTLRRWQASQARLTDVDMAGDAVSEEKGVAQREVCVQRRLHSTEREDVDRYSNRNACISRTMVLD